MLWRADQYSTDTYCLPGNMFSTPCPTMLFLFINSLVNLNTFHFQFTFRITTIHFPPMQVLEWCKNDLYLGGNCAGPVQMPDSDLSLQSAGSARFHPVPQRGPLFPPKVSSGCAGLFEGTLSIMESHFLDEARRSTNSTLIKILLPLIS